MAFTTTNATTIVAAVKLRERILSEFRDIKPLIQLDTPKSLQEVLKKLRFIVNMIEIFMNDEKANLYKSDKIALEDLLQAGVVNFISVFESKSEIERLKIAVSLEKMAKDILQTD